MKLNRRMDMSPNMIIILFLASFAFKVAVTAVILTLKNKK